MYWLIACYLAGGVLTSLFVAQMPWFLTLGDRVFVFVVWPWFWLGYIFGERP